MRTKDTGETLGAVKGDPCKLSAVVVQKSRRQADAPSGGYIDPRRIMVGAVEVMDLSGADQPVLDRPERLGGTAAHHQRPAIKVLFADQVLVRQGIIPVRDQVDPALKKVVDLDAGHLPRLLLQGKDHIRFIPKKCLHAVLIPKDRGDLHVRLGLRKQTYGLRKKVNGLPDHQADGDAVLILGAEILPLLDGALQILPHTGQEGNELRSGRCQRGALAASLKDGEADLLLQQPDLIGKGGLADEHIVGCPAEIQRPGKLDAVIELFGGHGLLLLFKS